MNKADFVEALGLANGKDDCTCNVANHSDNPTEHDPYCAFPLMRRAAAEVERAGRARQWLRAQTNAEKEPKARAAFVEAHNAVLPQEDGMGQAEIQMQDAREKHAQRVRDFATELRKWWSFDDRQQHTHSWHSREDFIEKKLPGLLR